MDVGPWLKGLGLEEYAQAFAENGVDTALLPELTNEDLKDLGVTRLADRKRLLKAIVGLAEENEKTETTSSQPRASAGERRQLTVVFVDLVGSTELSGRLDPEDYRDVMKAYQDAAAGVVARYGGHVGEASRRWYAHLLRLSQGPRGRCRTRRAIRSRNRCLD